MPPFPRAYHITFGTYGTRLHGDERGTVDRHHNKPGDPIVGRAEHWEQWERSLLKHEPVLLTIEQRLHGQQAIEGICVRGGWTYHIAACRGDHIHAMLTALADGKAVRRWLKNWLGQALSRRWPLPDGATWWSEAGAVKPVWSDEYFENVYAYILGQRTTT